MSKDYINTSGMNSLNNAPKPMKEWSGRSGDMQRHAAETGNPELSAKANEIWYDTEGKYGGKLSTLAWTLPGVGMVNHLVQNWRKESDYKNLVETTKTKAQINWALDERSKEKPPLFLRGNLGAEIPEDLV